MKSKNHSVVAYHLWQFAASALVTRPQQSRISILAIAGMRDKKAVTQSLQTKPLLGATIIAIKHFFAVAPRSSYAHLQSEGVKPQWLIQENTQQTTS